MTTSFMTIIVTKWKKQYVLGNTGLLQHFFTLLARRSVEMHKRVHYIWISSGAFNFKKLWIIANDQIEIFISFVSLTKLINRANKNWASQNHSYQKMVKALLTQTDSIDFWYWKMTLNIRIWKSLVALLIILAIRY